MTFFVPISLFKQQEIKSELFIPKFYASVAHLKSDRFKFHIRTCGAMINRIGILADSDIKYWCIYRYVLEDFTNADTNKGLMNFTDTDTDTSVTEIIRIRGHSFITSYRFGVVGVSKSMTHYDQL